jgi:transposase-like protein
MATLYVMNLEDRVDIARNQLAQVILRLREAVRERRRPDEVEQAVDSAATQLQHISELIGH